MEPPRETSSDTAQAQRAELQRRHLAATVSLMTLAAQAPQMLEDEGRFRVRLMERQHAAAANDQESPPRANDTGAADGIAPHAMTGRVLRAASGPRLEGATLPLKLAASGLCVSAGIALLWAGKAGLALPIFLAAAGLAALSMLQLLRYALVLRAGGRRAPAGREAAA